MKKSLITLAVLMVLAATSGCASVTDKLENRVVCTLAKDNAYMVSEYGPVGISSKVSDKDRVAICK